MKTCTHCHTPKELSEFGRDSRAKSGSSLLCKACMKLKNKANYDKHAEKRRASARAAAAKDRASKSEYNRFYREQNRERLVEASRAWRAAGNKANRSLESKQRNKERMRLRYATDGAYRERVKEAAALYRKTNPIKVRSAAKLWRAKNINAARKYGRERMWSFYQTPEGKAWMKEMRIKHRAKRQARRAVYYARRYGESGIITNTYLNWLHKWQHHSCCYCNVPLDGKETIEHVVPLSRGGENNPHNVLLACRECNFRKQDRLFDESEWQPDAVHTARQLHSTYGMGVAEQTLTAGAVSVSRETDHLILPGGKPLFVLSTFWLSERARPPTSLVELRALYPDALLTFDYEWIARPQALLNVVRAKDGQAPSVGARTLEVESPTAAEARDFMDLWHIQGFAGGSWYLGLRHPSTKEWHAMASFRRLGTDYEIARLAFRDHVTGGASRLVHAFRRTLPDITDLWTYADSRFGEGLGYASAGFDPMGETGGWYGYVNGTGIHARQAYRKTSMATELDWFDPSWPEHRLARANGLWRINGLPQKRFVLRA